MATTRRRRAVAVAERLAREPGRFALVDALRVLEAAARRDAAHDARFQARAPLGGDAEPQREVARLGGVLSLAFPAAEIASFRPGDGGAPPRLGVSFLGLVGPGGILPRHYTEIALAAQRARSTALSDLLDLFTHRLLSLYARAAVKYRHTRLVEAAPPGATDPVTVALKAVIGLGTRGLAGRLSVPDEVPVFYGGLFAQAPASAARIEAMVSDLLGRPVRVVQFVGAWLALPPSEQSRLPGPGFAPGAHGRLGVDAAIGTHAWNPQAAFLLQLGPLDAATFASLLPGGRLLNDLVHLVRGYVGPTKGFAVNPLLAPDAVPRLVLGGAGAAAPRLGWTTWIGERHDPRPADEAVFRAAAVEALAGEAAARGATGNRRAGA
ncbi:type VI secretion system baseplate subunit TssG [Elioraea sp.]|uniref:type VI secretion system baseplate subunit TssG n=1 Tax=Elioraea sp. TaxID=2185103 RepID=UPI003F6F0E84